MGVFAGRGNQFDAYGVSMVMRDSVRLWETAYIAILNPGPSRNFFRRKDPEAFIWHGWARVQPYRREVPMGIPNDPTVMQSTRFQIDFTKDGVVPLVRNDYVVVVLSAAQINDPDHTIITNQQPDQDLIEYMWNVRSSMNSSLAWVRTLETVADQQQRNNLQLQPDGDGGLEWVPDPAPDPEPDPEP